jgi:GMP synthase-like glutamine amidotransferase
MRIHYLQHVLFEDPANILTWAAAHHHPITKTLVFRDSNFPACDDFDLLLVMGGPMGVYDLKEYPWLAGEKEFIRAAIQSKKKILGICLGAQLLADILGARVTKNKHKEIGWFAVQKTALGMSSPLFSDIPDIFPAFHWHGDTFDIPPGCRLLASSEACINQAFSFDDFILGLQFHLESTRQSIAKLIANCAGELVDDTFIQQGDSLLDDDRLRISNHLMDNLLHRLINQ